MTTEDTQIPLDLDIPKKSDRLNRSMSARMQRQKAKAIKKLKEFDDNDEEDKDNTSHSFL